MKTDKEQSSDHEKLIEESDYRWERIYGRDIFGQNNMKYHGKTKKISYNKKVHESIDDIAQRKISVKKRVEKKRNRGSVFWTIILLLIFLIWLPIEIIKFFIT